MPLALWKNKLLLELPQKKSATALHDIVLLHKNQVHEDRLPWTWLRSVARLTHSNGQTLTQFRSTLHRPTINKARCLSALTAPAMLPCF